MSTYNITNAKEDLGAILHSNSDLTKVRNVYYLMARSARNVQMKCDVPETIKLTQISNSLHNDIFDYTAPSDLKGNKIIDIRPQINRNLGDSFGHRLSKQFDVMKRNNTFNVKYNSATKSLRIAKALTAGVTLHECDDTDNNGNWAVGGDATNLTKDNLDFVSGSGSLNFDLNALGSVGYIEIADMSDIDLTDEDEKGSIWLRVYIPDPSIITNFILRWGNDSSNYWSRTITAPHDQTTFKTGWNILRFDWNGATETGTVDPATIDYLRFSVTYDGTAETDIRIDKIVCSVGEIWEIEYYSDALFRSTAGVWLTRPTSDNDILNMGEEGINLWLYECALAMAQQTQGEDAIFDASFFGGVTLDMMYKKYKKNNPSQVIKAMQTYYNINLY